MLTIHCGFNGKELHDHISTIKINVERIAPMYENVHNYPQQEVLDQMMVQHNHRPNWKRIYHTWSFWIFLFLMLAGIMYYKVTINFLFAL